MFWEILKIEPTADKKAITSAYRKLLAVTSPEDDQEAFMELRKAYEEALAYAEAHSENRILSPVELWQQELGDLYDDFRRRNEVSEWQKLFNNEVCLSLDTRTQCEEILLHFLMDHFFLTHDVWVYFDTQFSWTERQEELYESYPRDFIDYAVMNGIRFSDTLPMKMFIPGRDGDACNVYLKLFLQACRMEGDQDELMKNLFSLPEQHPYGNALFLARKAEDDDDDEAQQELKQLHEQYPEDIYIAVLLCETYFGRGEYDACLALSKQMQELYPDHERFLRFEAFSLAEKGQNSDAVHIIDKLLGDPGVEVQKKYELNEKRSEINLRIIADLEQKINAETEDETRMDLAWAYLENNMFDKTDELLKQVSDDYEDRFNYINLRSYTAMSLGRTEEAAEYLRQLIEVIKELPEDTEKNIRRKKRLGEVYSRLGSALYRTDHEQAMKAYEKAVEVSEKPADALDQLTYVYLSERQYDKAAETAEKMIQVNPAGFRGYMAYAYACFFRHMDREAYNAVDRALDLNGSDLQLYVLKARILLRNDAAEGAEELINFMINSGFEDETSVLFLRGILAEEKDQDPAEAERLYELSLKSAEENNTSESYKSELVYRYLCLKGEHLDAAVKEDREEMLSLTEEGLRSNPEHYGLLDYRAWLLERDRKYDEALKIYLKLAENPNHGYSVDTGIGHIYYQDLMQNADKALKYYSAALEKGGPSYCHFYMGMCFLYMLKLDEAEEQFILLKEKEPDSVDGWFRLSYVYAMRNETEKALAYADKSVEIMRGRKGNQVSYFEHKAALLRRLRRFDEAVEVIREAMRLYDYPYGNRVIFDIYCQAGEYDKAGGHLRDWEKGVLDSELYDCAILFHMYRGNFAEASLESRMSAKYLTKDRQFEVKHILSRYYGDYKKEYDELMAWLRYREENNLSDISRIKGALAMCCFRMNDREKAEKYAREAIEEIDRRLALFEPDRLLFTARKTRLLALLNRMEEAEETVRLCRTLPQCQFCPEHSCKDMELFCMEIEEILGNTETVKKMAEMGMERYPNEEEFVIERQMVKKKVR